MFGRATIRLGIGPHSSNFHIMYFKRPTKITVFCLYNFLFIRLVLFLEHLLFCLAVVDSEPRLLLCLLQITM